MKGILRKDFLEKGFSILFVFWGLSFAKPLPKQCPNLESIFVGWWSGSANPNNNQHKTKNHQNTPPPPLPPPPKNTKQKNEKTHKKQVDHELEPSDIKLHDLPGPFCQILVHHRLHCFFCQKSFFLQNGRGR